MKTYLLPIADREPLEWIVTRQRTAFSALRAREAEALEPGDQLLLYTTRGCFHNPTRDRGRIIGLARVTARSEELSQPVRFADREYPVGLMFAIERLAPRREGIELSPLVERLASFSNPRTWKGRMRRALVPLVDEDAAFLVHEVKKVARPYPDDLATYAA